MSLSIPFNLCSSIHLPRGTTVYGFNKYAPELLDLGLGGMIGKGKRSKVVSDAIIKNRGIYFAAVGGAGALLSKCIVSSEIVAYNDLETEAIRKLEVKNFPVIVVIDKDGNVIPNNQ